jgi:hypothetical protein
LSSMVTVEEVVQSYMPFPNVDSHGERCSGVQGGNAAKDV